MSSHDADHLAFTDALFKQLQHFAFFSTQDEDMRIEANCLLEQVAERGLTTDRERGVMAYELLVEQENQYSALNAYYRLPQHLSSEQWLELEPRMEQQRSSGSEQP